MDAVLVLAILFSCPVKASRIEMIVPKNVSLCLIALAGLICLTPDRHVTAEGPALASLVQYNRDVRPILSENCFFCHGFDQGNRQADLRLDTQEGATADLGDYAAILPGDPQNSELLTRIFTDDPDLKMPPADSVYALTDQQRETLRRWIEQGAHYEKHWAFRALQKPDVPENKKTPSPTPTPSTPSSNKPGPPKTSRPLPRQLPANSSADSATICEACPPPSKKCATSKPTPPTKPSTPS